MFKNSSCGFINSKKLKLKPIDKIRIIKDDTKTNNQEEKKVGESSSDEESITSNEKENNSYNEKTIESLRKELAEEKRINLEKEDKILSLAKANEKLSINLEKINIQVSKIYEQKIKKKIRKSDSLKDTNEEKQIKILEKENKNLINLQRIHKNENKHLKKQIDELINKDKETIYNLNTEIHNKNNRICLLQFEISKLKRKINNLEKLKEANNNFFKKENPNKDEVLLREKILKLNEEIILIKNENEIQERIIKEAKNIISSLSLKLRKFKETNGDNINAKFSSSDQLIKNCLISCSKKDIFAEVEEKLYEEYPQCRNTYNTFICGGKKILKNKTLEENQIENQIPILVIITKKNDTNFN